MLLREHRWESIRGAVRRKISDETPGKNPHFSRIGETLSGFAQGTRRARLSLFFLVVLILVTGIAACAEEKPVPVSYDLKVDNRTWAGDGRGTRQSWCACRS